MNYQEHLAADRRLSLLLLLSASPGYEANEYLLREGLAEFGHQATHTQVTTDLAWLSEQGLLSLCEIGGIGIAKATARGLDVSSGRAIVPGVKQPHP